MLASIVVFAGGGMVQYDIHEVVGFYVPPVINSFSVLKFSCYISKLPLARKYCIDFSRMYKVLPFGALVVPKLISQFVAKKKEAAAQLDFVPQFLAKGIDVANIAAHGYAAHIGFFRFFDCSVGKDVAEALGSNSYVPIRHIDVDAVHACAGETRRHYGDVIEEASMQLSKFLIRDENSNAVELLTYSIRELMRNVVEHSHAKTIWYCGQYYQSNNTVDIAILDEGVGIESSLSRNPDLTIESGLQAIQMALCPGVSRVSAKRQKALKYDDWANSGFGLYATSKLCLQCGNFLVLSGQDAILVGKDNLNFYKADFQGTVVHVSISIENVSNFKASLADIVRAGTKLAKKGDYPAIRTASMVSSMLRANYE